MMRKFRGLALIGIALSCLYLGAEAHPNLNAALKSKADSLFRINYGWAREASLDQYKGWLREREGKWGQAMDDAGLGAEERHMAATYGKAKLLIAKYEFIVSSSYGNLHAEALGEWAQEGQDIEDPALTQLDKETAYEYVRAYLETRFVTTRPRTQYNFELFSGRLKAVEFLLQSGCPDAVKHAYLNFDLPLDLRRVHISPEIAILEPYIRKGFKDQTLVHYYDSLLNWHHRLDKGNMAPDFTLRNHNGKLVKLSELRGKKVVIDCWATWCSGCIANMPAYDSLAHANKDPNTVFLSASIDDIDSGGVSVAWRNYITKHRFDPAVHLNGPKKEMAEFREAYNISGVPHYFIIDKEGKIVSLHCVFPRDPEFIRDLKN